MSDYRLPSGDPAWFVRTRTGSRYTINPCSRAGWMLLIGFCLYMVLPPILLVTGGSEPLSTARIAVFALLVVVPTILFIVTLIRKSVPAPTSGL